MIDLSPAVFATVGCGLFISAGVDWDQDDLPLAPAAALAEWLRREPCPMCGGRCEPEPVEVVIYAADADWESSAPHGPQPLDEWRDDVAFA